MYPLNYFFVKNKKNSWREHVFIIIMFVFSAILYNKNNIFIISNISKNFNVRSYYLFFVIGYVIQRYSK